MIEKEDQARILFLKRRRKKIAKIMARKRLEEDKLLNLTEFEGDVDVEDKDDVKAEVKAT